MSTSQGKHKSDLHKSDTQTLVSQQTDFNKLNPTINTHAATVNHATEPGHAAIRDPMLASQAQGMNHAMSDSHEAHPRIDHMSNQAHDAVERVAHAAERSVEQLEHGAARIERQAEQLSATGQHWADSIGENIRRHPVATLGVAVASGAILSWLLRSRG